MFATQQQFMDTALDASRKRPCDDVDTPGTLSFAEHRNKRIQCLPLRTSQPQSQSSFNQSTNYQLQSSNSDMSMDADAEITPLNSMPGVPNAVQLNDEATGRMPTPIQPTFAAQVRGQGHQWAESGRNGLVNMGHQHSGFIRPSNLSSRNANADWRSFQNNRSLPSPISEVEQPTHDSGECEHMGQRQGSHGDADSMRGMEHPNCMMDVETPKMAHQVEEGGEPSSPSPARKGHIRSMHTVNSWTWQPGMKRSFSIGFRSDCDKCRDKVPGHFNHIIVS